MVVTLYGRHFGCVVVAIITIISIVTIVVIIIIIIIIIIIAIQSAVPLSHHRKYYTILIRIRTIIDIYALARINSAIRGHHP